MYRAIAANKRNTVVIIVLFLVIIAALGFVANFYYLGATGNYSIAIFVILGSVAYAVIQYFAASRQAVALSGGTQIEKRDNPRLYRTVENLAITMGMPMPKVYIIDDPAPNAFATGRDPEHAIVAATTGLLETMDDAELEGVMAHELGHVKNCDIRMPWPAPCRSSPPTVARCSGRTRRWRTCGSPTRPSPASSIGCSPRIRRSPTAWHAFRRAVGASSWSKWAPPVSRAAARP